MAAKDVVFIAIIIFAVGLAFFIGHLVVNSMINGIVQNPQVNSSEKTVAALENTKALSQRFDYVVLGLFIGLTLALFVTGWFIAGNPIFTALYFIIVVVAVLTGGILSNIWQTVSTASVFGTTVASFPITNNLLSNLQIYIAVIGIVGLIVMFGKPYFTGEAIP